MRNFIVPLLLFLSVACRIGSPTSPSANELYENFLNLKLPQDIRNFDGEGEEAFPVFASQAYFTYEAEKQYFEMLEKHNKVIEQSDFNEEIHAVPCDSNEFISDFSYWTDQKIDLEERSCFTGVFFPFVHYFVFNPVTEDVHHFVTGMSE